VTAPRYSVGGNSYNNVGGAISALDQHLAGVDSNIANLQHQVSNNHSEARRGIAAAMAMPKADMPSAPGKVTYAAQVASYRGKGAIGAAFAYRFDTDFPLAATAGVSWAGKKDFGATVGVKGEF
jgi:trimeric autotransporter adhesin